MPPKRGRGRGSPRARGRGRGRGGDHGAWRGNQGNKDPDIEKEGEELAEKNPAEDVPTVESDSNKLYGEGTEEKLLSMEEETHGENDEIVGRTFLKEEDVGITEYCGTQEGFHGIIKQRYSDFIVNEIDQDGEIVKLKSLDVEDTGVPATEEEEDSSELDGILTEEQTQKLTEFNASPNPDRIIDFSVPDDKVKRAKIHQIVRVRYKNLESDTVFEDDIRFIRIVPKGKARRRGKAQFRKEFFDWPKDMGKYCRFVLYKENMDTMDAIFKLTKFFRVSKNLFQYAGTKDKRAITSQEVTVYRVRAEKLQKANRYFYKMALGNFRYVDQPLKLGQLNGNRFTIVLRNVTGSDSAIEAGTRILQELGFINYYGMQRFGTTTIPTFHVGRAILKNDYKEAGELILQPRPGEMEFVAECRKKWWEDKNSLSLLAKLPRRYSIERSLLEGLIKYGENNYANAFQKIHRNTRLMYLHGYQSYIWNRIVSRRIKQYGLKPILGDLVYKGDLKEVAFKEGRDDQEEEEGANTEEEKESTLRPTPTVVESCNISQYTIHDVIMPLPGFDILYPNNEVAYWFKELLAEDGLTMESLKHSNKQYALPGAYRRMVLKPRDVSYKTYLYSDVTKELTLSDLDCIHQKEEPQSESSGTLRALKLEMTLPPSSYATMALREILKIDTSAAYQSTLNSGPQPERVPTALAIKEFQAKMEASKTTGTSNGQN